MSTPPTWAADVSLEEIISLAGQEALVPHVWLKARTAFPSLGALLEAKKNDLAVLGLTPLQLSALQQRPRLASASLRQFNNRQIKVVLLGEPGYPPLLSQITDPPVWLFYRGELNVLRQPTLTVVGTRKPSAYALSAMKYVFPEELLRHITIASGLAYGIDKAAHEAALRAGGQTVAVLAGGLDQVYPADHGRLAEKIIAAGGALVSEYPPLSRPRPYRFPIRNRILAGLSRLTVVVEAAMKSGTLTTAKAAIDYNRDLMAVPGEINRRAAEGGNFLIKHGASPLTDPFDLLNYFQINQKKQLAIVDKQTSHLLDLVISPKTVDELVLATGQEVETILSGLTELELLGLVYQPQPSVYQQQK